jgi:hypothetical protein
MRHGSQTTVRGRLRFSDRFDTQPGSLTGLIRYQGQAKSLRSWCDELGLKYGTTYSRLRRGWPVERAFTNVNAKIEEAQ